MAQSVISGKVSNAEGGGVDFVSVIASPTNAPKTILASAFSDENGKFQMSVKSECDSLILKASSIEIAPAQITVPNRSGSYEIIVENRAVELKEVVVKSKKVYSRGDTINYNVGSFLSQTDQSIPFRACCLMNGSMMPKDLPEPGVPNTIVPRNGLIMLIQPLCIRRL